MMTDYTIFNPATGEVLRSGSCPTKMLGHQVRQGESILVGQALDDVSMKVEVDATGRKLPKRRSEAEIALRMPQGAPVNSQAELARQMQAKGITAALAERLALRQRAKAGG